MDVNTPTSELLDTIRNDVTQENTQAAILHLTTLVEKLSLTLFNTRETNKEEPLLE